MNLFTSTTLVGAILAISCTESMLGAASTSTTPRQALSGVPRLSNAPTIESPVKRALREARASIAPDGPTGLPGDIAAAFGLLRGTAFHLEPAAIRLGGRMSVSVPHPAGGMMELHLRPHSVRTRDFKLVAYTADGLPTEMSAGEVHTVRGSVAEIPGARVAGSYRNGELTAAIFMPDGSRLSIDPMSRAVPNALPGDHVTYFTDDIAPHDARCGVGDDHGHGHAGGIEGEGGVAGDGGVAGVVCDTQLVIDCDLPFMNRSGGTVLGTAARAETIVNIANAQYENQVGIRHLISGLIVRNTAAVDPYTGNALCTGGPNDLLTQTSSWWGNTQAPPFVALQRDAVHLFTGRVGGFGTVGCAYVGDVCATAGDHVAHAVSSIDFSPNTALSTDLFAHESGHNWNATHCSCSSPASTMNASLTGANTFANSPSIGEIAIWRNTHDSCLDCVNAAIDGCGDPLAGSPWSIRPTPYSNAADCCAIVCAQDYFCCGAEWDQLCVEAAAVSCIGCGSPGAGSPYAPHANPGCNDVACCATVCAVDPGCCDAAWDLPCVARAESFCRSGLTCEDARFASPLIPGSLEFDSTEAPIGFEQSPCGAADTRAVWYKFFAPCTGSVSIETCAELAAEQVTLVVYDACGETAVACATRRPHDPCSMNDCRVTFVAMSADSPYWLRVSVHWDLATTGTLRIFCNDACNNPAAGSCFETHGPGCGDAACCSRVCNTDPYCCDVGWDELCVNMAMGYCQGAPDLNGDGLVDAADLTILLGAWGTPGGDLDGNGTTNATDLAMLLGSWG